MVPFSAAASPCSLSPRYTPLANQLGKRYSCGVCGTLVLCVKQGNGSFFCCDKEMEIQVPRALPSSD